MKTYDENRRAARQVFITLLSVLLTIGSPFPPVNAPSMAKAQAEEPIVKLEPKDFAAKAAWEDYGWGKNQFICLASLWGKESAWNHLADNPHSTAFGIAQMLGEDSRDAEVQITNGLRYIEHRYETPCEAWSFWKRNSYY